MTQEQRNCPHTHMEAFGHAIECNDCKMVITAWSMFPLAAFDAFIDHTPIYNAPAIETRSYFRLSQTTLTTIHKEIVKS